MMKIMILHPTPSRPLYLFCLLFYLIKCNDHSVKKSSYSPQKKYLLRRSCCHRGVFHSQEVIEYINEKLKATWSPEQIACTPCALKIPS